MRTTKQQRINALVLENEQLRTLCAEWAQDAKRLRLTIVKLTARRAASFRTMPNATERQAAIAYCAQHGVPSVTRQALRGAA